VESVESVNQSVRRPLVQFVNQSNVQQPRCCRNGLGLDFSFITKQKEQIRESFGRQVRGEEIRHQEVAEESQNNPQNNGNLDEAPVFL